jgi:hypothetical protein
MNILFTTTKQWNVGDEIILKGTRNLLTSKIGPHTYIPWNRHPSIRPGNSFRDNSFDELRHSFAAVDYTIFAGSPEWSGPRLEPLFQLLKTSGKRCSFIGIGSSSHSFHSSPALLQVLRDHTDAVTCRDQCTYDMLRGIVDPFRLFLLPCPSTFFSGTIQQRDDIKVIGLNYQATATTWHNITEPEHTYMLNLFKEISKHFDVRIICNYIDDLIAASQYFPRNLLRYSPDRSDFQDFYQEVDAVIGTRVHGCMGALSNGLPSWLINFPRDLRRKGVAQQILPLREIGTESPAEVISLIRGLSVTETQQAISDFKTSTLQRFQPVLDLISPPLSIPTATSPFLAHEPSLELRSQTLLRFIQELPYKIYAKYNELISR